MMSASLVAKLVHYFLDTKDGAISGLTLNGLLNVNVLIWSNWYNVFLNNANYSFIHSAFISSIVLSCLNLNVCPSLNVKTGKILFMPLISLTYYLVRTKMERHLVSLCLFHWVLNRTTIGLIHHNRIPF